MRTDIMEDENTVRFNKKNAILKVSIRMNTMK